MSNDSLDADIGEKSIHFRFSEAFKCILFWESLYFQQVISHKPYPTLWNFSLTCIVAFDMEESNWLQVHLEEKHLIYSTLYTSTSPVDNITIFFTSSSSLTYL